MKNLLSVYAFLVLAMLVLFAPGCAKPFDENAVNNPPIGVVDDDAGFYLRYVATNDYTYDLHRDPAGFGVPCRPTTDSNVNKSLDCFLDGHELDLYYWGVKLQYNVPRDMCKYVRFMPYFYSRYRFESAPTVVRRDTDRNGAVCYDANNNGTCDPGETSEECQWDYTANKGPNCCEGRYRAVSRVWNPALAPGPPPVAGYAAATNTEANWTGAWKNCFDGPANKTQPKNVQGYPLSDLINVDGVGLNRAYEIDAPIQQARNSNAYFVNFFIPALHTTDPDGFPLATTFNTFSLAANIAVPGRPRPPQGFPYYELLCLDEAYDTIAAIHLFIREWNTAADFANRARGLPGDATAYDTSGAEPNPFGVFPNNDKFDWDDFGDATQTFGGAWTEFRD